MEMVIILRPKPGAFIGTEQAIALIKKIQSENENILAEATTLSKRR